MLIIKIFCSVCLWSFWNIRVSWTKNGWKPFRNIEMISNGLIRLQGGREHKQMQDEGMRSLEWKKRQIESEQPEGFQGHASVSKITNHVKSLCLGNNKPSVNISFNNCIYNLFSLFFFVGGRGIVFHSTLQ